MNASMHKVPFSTFQAYLGCHFLAYLLSVSQWSLKVSAILWRLLQRYLLEATCSLSSVY